MTRSLRFLSVPLVSLGLIGLPAVASAEQAGDGKPLQEAKVAEPFRAAPAMPRARSTSGPDSWPASVKAIFVGVEGGVGFASVKHPSVATPHLMGPLLSFQAGYRVSPRWSVSVVYTDFQQHVSRGGGGELFGASSQWLHTAAECTHCTPPAVGGAVLAATFRLSTLGPAIDVTPFGRDGIFLGASGGVAMTSLVDTVYGVAGTARAGYRFRPFDNLAFSIEGGAQGHSFTGGSAALGYGAAEVRLNF